MAFDLDPHAEIRSAALDDDDDDDDDDDVSGIDAVHIGLSVRVRPAAERKRGLPASRMPAACKAVKD